VSFGGSRGWPADGDLSGVSEVCSPYHYRSAIRGDGEDPFTSSKPNRAATVNDPAAWAILADAFCSQMLYSHHQEGHNVLFVDAHGAWLADPEGDTVDLVKTAQYRHQEVFWQEQFDGQ
jgi:hypothetical protein